ncbi:MAG: RNA polymerase sigma factor SigM [Propionibacteriales bacterium]|nr:RNA polymerase sigma factor SigM [Propionibacteriales bacterium]
MNDRPSLEPVDDAELMARHQAGDAAAFEEIFRRHRDRLWAVALRTLGDPDQAADALQDAMLSAFRRAGSFRGDAQVTTWLHRIVVNACIDLTRRNKVRAADPLPADEDRRLALADPRVGEPAARIAERHDVRAALATLPFDQRAALVLVNMEGYSVAEAAALLDCPEGTVKSRCARGRARLAPLLRPLWNPDDPSSVPSVSGPEQTQGGDPA